LMVRIPDLKGLGNISKTNSFLWLLTSVCRVWPYEQMLMKKSRTASVR